MDYEISRYLSFILRHNTNKLSMSSDGFILVNDLIDHLNNKYTEVVDFERIKRIVQQNKKQRFYLKEIDSFWYIRANQGHSLRNINLDFKVAVPTSVLYHGTGLQYVNSILANGLCKKNRHHVHLSDSKELAYTVGIRHGEVRIFKINTQQMISDGKVFYLSQNHVWLTDFVDSKYLSLCEL